jgi:hypothetical protein
MFQEKERGGKGEVEDRNQISGYTQIRGMCHPDSRREEGSPPLK